MSSPIPQAIAGQVLLATAKTADYGTPAYMNPGGDKPAGDEYDPETDPQTDLPRRGSLTLMSSLAGLHAAMAGYARADEMYDGESGDLPMSEAIQRLVARSGVHEVEDLNYARVPVDSISDKLGIRAVVASAGDEAESDDETAEGPEDDPETGTNATVDQTDVDPADSDDEVQIPPPPVSSSTPPQQEVKSPKARISEQAQERLNEIRKANQMDAEEVQLMHRVSKYGDAYLFVWPIVQAASDDPEDDPDGDGFVPLDAAHPEKIVGVDIYVNSPHTVRAFYDEEQPLKMTHVIKSWEWIDPDDPDADKPKIRATLYFPDRIERWVTKAGGKVDDREAWRPYLENDGDQWPLPLPDGVDQIPFFHFRNDRPYGVPEHKPAYGPQRLINKLISAHGVTIDFQIFPQRYALLDPKGDNSLMNLLNPDTPDDEDDDPEGNGYSQLRADPSAVWKLYATAVGQFQAADPSTFITPLDRYIESISELTSLPLERFNRRHIPPSGESRRIGNEALYEKIGQRRRLYGAVLSDAYEFALSLMGFGDIEVTVKWKPLDAAAGPDDWNMVNTKIAVGVPVKTALVEAGYPDDEVDEWLLNQDGADLTRRVALLNSIGTAVQALSAGVAVGMVSSEQAGNIIARVIGRIGEDLPPTDTPIQLHPQAQAQQMDLQNTMRNRQLNEHIASQTPSQGPPDENGNPTQGPPPDLPPMPPPIPPVKVGQ